jgi:hypothetical protein
LTPARRSVNAAVLVLIVYLLTRFVGDGYGRALLEIILFIARGVYVGFAVATGSSGAWFLAEMMQAVALGVLGLLGLRGSPYWLAAGWALHPLWDFFLHYLGSGHEFATESWAIACVSFDLVVAAYIVVAAVVKRESRRPTTRSSVRRRWSGSAWMPCRPGYRRP